MLSGGLKLDLPHLGRLRELPHVCLYVLDDVPLRLDDLSVLPLTVLVVARMLSPLHLGDPGL